jgi:hypothetical protein
VLALAVALVAIRQLPEGKGHEVAWHDISSVGPLTFTSSERRLFRDQEQLSRYLKKRAGSERPAPQVDFSNRQLLLVSPGPRSSTGYFVDVLSVRERGGKITVSIRERAPSLTDRVDPHVTYPYRLISLPAGEDVYVDWVGR